MCKSVKGCESSEAFAPTEVKIWLNSLVTSFRSLVYTHWEDSLRGMQFRMTFHLELVLLLLSSFLFKNFFSGFLSSDLTLSRDERYSSQSASKLRPSLTAAFLQNIPVVQQILNFSINKETAAMFDPYRFIKGRPGHNIDKLVIKVI